MSVSFGGSQKTKPQTQTMTRNVAAPSQEEALLQVINHRVAQQQAEQLQRAMMQQQQFEQSPLYGQLGALQGQAATGLQGIIGGQLITPQQQAAQQQYFQSIMAPALAQMQQTAGQEAARRGMTISDSPIGGEYLRQLANYQAQMGGQQAGQALQLQGQNQNMFQNVLNFGNQLRQSADQNRLALAQAQPGSYGFGQQLAQQRTAQAPVTQRTSGGMTTKAPTYNVGAGEAGNFLFGQGRNTATGLGGLFGAFGLGG